MPELPEVEVTRLGLLTSLPGRRVVKIVSGSKRLRTEIPSQMLASHVLGTTFVTVERRAKYLLFRMSGGATMVVHLGMTGKFGIIPAEEPAAFHDHLRIRLDNGMELRYNDTRRFGSIMVWSSREAKGKEALFSGHIGVEPFGRRFTVNYLQQKSCARKLPVKNFLMDSRIVAGIGNIYANEILFAASVNPLEPVNSISGTRWKTIIASTRRILREAIRTGGSTISDFLGTSGNPGYFQVQFNVYDRAGQQCRQCGTTILRSVVGGRATFFCPRCQPLQRKK